MRRGLLLSAFVVGAVLFTAAAPWRGLSNGDAAAGARAAAVQPGSQTVDSLTPITPSSPPDFDAVARDDPRVVVVSVVIALVFGMVAWFAIDRGRRHGYVACGITRVVRRDITRDRA